MTSALENLFAMQLDAAGLTQYVREYQAIPGRRYKWDFAFVRERLLIEVQGGVWNGGAHGRPVGITRDMDKLNVATKNGWNTLQFETKMVKNLDDDGLSQAVKTTKETLINQSKQEQ